MVIIHDSWDLLKKKLAQKDNTNIKKRVGANRTAVVIIERHKYDPNIPVFSKEKLEAFLRGQKLPQQPQPKPKPQQPQPEPKQQVLPRPQQQPSPKPQYQPQPEPKQQAPPRPQQQPSPKPKQQPQPKPQQQPTPNIQQQTKSKPQQEIKLQPQKQPRDLLRDKIPKKVTKKRRKNKSIWKGAIDELVIKEEIDDDFCKFIDDDSDEETVMSKNLKKIRSEPIPSKPSTYKSPQKSTIKRELDPLPKLSPEKQAPPKVVEPQLPNWPETVKKFEENDLNIVYKDLYHFRAHIKSDARAKALPKEMVIKCLQDDRAFLLLDMLALTFELNYNDDKQFWSEIVGRLKRKLNTNCGMVKYKSNANTNPDQIRDAYKRAVSEIDNYTRDQNITLTLPYLDFIFLTSSNIQQPVPDSNAPTGASQPNGVLEPRQPVLKNETPSEPQIQEAPTVSESEDPQLQPKPEAPLIPADQIKSRSSPPLRPLNRFIVKFPVDIKPDIKNENGCKQENTDPAVERKITFVKNKDGKSVFQIKTSINRNKTQKFKHGL